MNYDELIADLRYCADTETSCSECKRIGTVTCEVNLHSEAADAIEQLEKKVTEWQEEACKWNNEYFALRDSMPRWISVKERLPEEQQDVLVYLKRGGCAVDYFIPSRNDKWGYRDVTHWIPLPTPPKEDE